MRASLTGGGCGCGCVCVCVGVVMEGSERRVYSDLIFTFGAVVEVSEVPLVCDLLTNLAQPSSMECAV